MSIIEIISIIIYMLPSLIALDKDKLTSALFLFIFLIIPILYKIYNNDFEFLLLMQLILWITSFLFLNSKSLLRK